MIVLTMLLAVQAPAPIQVLAGPFFEAFARRTEQLCPVRRLRDVTPGDLDLIQDDFRQRLPAAARRRLTAADRAGQARCDGHNGLSCPTVETLGAMRRTGLLERFAAYACSHRN